jgi:hypothetical protein
LTNLEDGKKVWVRQSNCGYQGPGILVGQVFGSSWLVKALKGDERILVARAEFLDEFCEGQTTPADLSKEEKKEAKKKYKAERKNHHPRGDGRR